MQEEDVNCLVKLRQTDKVPVLNLKVHLMGTHNIQKFVFIAKQIIPLQNVIK